jgi:hypothetical protein
MKYSFVVESKISLSTDVEAENLAEAVEKAKRHSVQSLCWQCSKGDPCDWNTGGELDCDPSSGTLVDAYCDGKQVPIESVDWEQENGQTT